MGDVAVLSVERLLVPAQRSKLLWRGTEVLGHTYTRLFGLDIADTSIASASRDLIASAHQGQRLRVVFANAHVINACSASAIYYQTVATADRIYADGSGLAVAARIAGAPLADNVNGTDLFPRLAADAVGTGVKLFLLGGRPGTTEAAMRAMQRFGIGGAIVGTHHGYFTPGSADEDAAIAKVNASGASILLVGMGVPLQDEWIARNAHRLNAPVLAGVGGLFDFFAGNIVRAPHAMRVIGCEWVWRLALEPRRMAGRYLIGNLKFLGLALAEGYRLRRPHPVVPATQPSARQT
jgi:exopolysaccharide biosynthesis WecB/TagA/CpsF family protein